MISLFLSIICKPKYLAVLGTTIALAIIADYSPAHAGCGEWMGSSSIAKSKRNKIFIRKVQVTPSTFKVENVDIEVEKRLIRLAAGEEIHPWLRSLLYSASQWRKREKAGFNSEHCLDFFQDKCRWVDYKLHDEIQALEKRLSTRLHEARISGKQLILHFWSVWQIYSL